MLVVIGMMKAILSILVFISASSLAQTYSQVVEDARIVSFVKWEIENTKRYSDEQKIWRKRLYYKPRSWGMAMLDLHGPISDTARFEQKFWQLYQLDTLFNQQDIAFIKEQYSRQIIAPWPSVFANAVTRKNVSRDFYEYTLPLFSKDFKRVLIWKYFYCGSLCAYACFNVYEQTDKNKWKLLRCISTWMS